MVIDGEGRFARVDDDGSVLYVLVNQQTESFSQESMRTLSTNGITFLLDVPRVANGDRVLTQMVELARRFAESLRGALVDDNRRPLIDSSIEPIRRQVAQFQAAMAARHLPAGGHLAQRLFS
jgi:FtsZ-interacting cell division protein ZipA